RAALGVLPVRPGCAVRGDGGESGVRLVLDVGGVHRAWPGLRDRRPGAGGGAVPAHVGSAGDRPGPHAAADPAGARAGGAGSLDPETGRSGRDLTVARGGGRPDTSVGAPAGRGVVVLLRRRQVGGVAGLLVLRLGSVLGLHHEPVADVADGADHRLVLRAELGPEPPDVHVHGAGAAVVVIAPDVAEQLLPAEHPAGVLGEVLQ